MATETIANHGASKGSHARSDPTDLRQCITKVNQTLSLGYSQRRPSESEYPDMKQTKKPEFRSTSRTTFRPDPKSPASGVFKEIANA